MGKSFSHNENFEPSSRQARSDLSFLYAGAEPSPSIRIAVFRTLAYMRLGGSRHPLIPALDKLANNPDALSEVEAVFAQVGSRDRHKLLADISELCWPRTPRRTQHR